MAKQKPSKPAKPASPAVDAKTLRPSPAPSPAETPLLAWLALGMNAFSVLAVTLALTPLTHNLDDIKVKLFYMLGPVLALAALIVIGLKHAPWPSRWVGRGLLAFGLAYVISGLLAKYHWVAWNQTRYLWAALGFFFSAMVIGAHEQTSRYFHRFLVLQLLLTNIIGIICFDFTRGGNHASFIGWLYQSLFQGSSSSSTFNDLLWTMYNADDSMLSTILSRDFYAAFCILYLPFAVSMILEPNSRKNHLLWQIVGGVTTLLTLVCIFYCRSKGEWIFLVVSLAFFAAMYASTGAVPRIRKQHLAALGGGMGLLLLVFAWMNSPTLMQQLKTVSYSVESRTIIWTGSIGVFKMAPIFGAGPGSFRIYFPEFRRSDYYEHEISNLTIYSHNYFLDLLCENGIVGITCYLVMLGALVFLAFKLIFKHRHSPMGVMLLTCLAGLLAMYGSNLSSPNARWVIGGAQLWTVLGFTVGLVRQAEGWKFDPETTDKPTSSHAHLFMVILLGLVGLFMLPKNIAYGRNYFDSAIAYQDGLHYMEPAYAAMGDANTKRTDIIFYLEKGAEGFTKAIELDEDNISAYYKLGSIYTTMSHIYRQMGDSFEKSKNAKDAVNYYELSDLRLEDARRTYEDLTKKAPDYAEIHFNLGIVYDNYADLAERNELAKAKPGSSNAEVEQAASNASQKYREKSLMHFARMSKMSRKSDVYDQLGQQYLSMNMLDRARDTYSTGSKEYPSDQKLASQYYIAAKELDDYRGMSTALERLWHENPADNQLADQILNLCYKQKLDDDLVRNLEHLRTINPVDAKIFGYRARLANRNGRHEEAAKNLALYQKFGGRNLETLWQGAESASVSGDTTGAQATYQLILQLDKDARTTYALQAKRQLASQSAATTSTLSGEAPTTMGLVR